MTLERLAAIRRSLERDVWPHTGIGVFVNQCEELLDEIDRLRALSAPATCGECGRRIVVDDRGGR